MHCYQVLEDKLDQVKEEAEGVVGGFEGVQSHRISLFFFFDLVDKLFMGEI